MRFRDRGLPRRNPAGTGTDAPPAPTAVVRHRLIPLCAALALVPAVVFGATGAGAQMPLPKPVETALIAPARLALPGVGTVDGVLSTNDIDRYRQIFDLQQDGKWPQADALIRRLDSRVLLGHVLAQRYLHPRLYRSRYKELHAWMADYADLPQAARIHRLAVLRQPRGVAGPAAPVRHRSIAPVNRDDSPDDGASSTRRQASAQSRGLRNTIHARVLRGWPTGAMEILNSAEARRDLAPWQADDARREIARAYYRAGKNDEALAVSLKTLAGDGAAPLAYWWGGLAAWRLGRIEDAQRLFTRLATSPEASDWAIASGGFWASRAYLVGGRPERVNDMLAIAAQYPMTFYGLLARHALGLESPIAWAEPAIAPADIADLAATPHGARALALLQLGRNDAAEAEMRNLAAARPDIVPVVLSLAVRAGLPSLSLRLAGGLSDDMQAIAAYPLPHWEPEDGFAIDRALVFAFIRQESAFDARAESHAGARGLMQLMPRTASYIAQEKELHGEGKNRLFDPAFNMALGQRYIAYLIENEAIGTDLFRLTAAYNAGPGNLRNWERSIDFGDDPLLFIESLPSRETRHFIERILTNFWIYRDRLGQPSPSLDNVVSGAWPGYVPQDATSNATTDAPLAQDQTDHAGH